MSLGGGVRLRLANKSCPVAMPPIANKNGKNSRSVAGFRECLHCQKQRAPQHDVEPSIHFPSLKVAAQNPAMPSTM